MLFENRGVHPHDGLVGAAVLSQLPVRHRRAVLVPRRAAEQIAGVNQREVLAHEALDVCREGHARCVGAVVAARRLNTLLLR